MSKTEKPPIGVVPKFIWDDRRVEMLANEIRQRTDGFYPIPMHYVIEYNELVSGFEEDEE